MEHVNNVNEKYQATYTYRGLAAPMHFNKGDIVFVEKLENSPDMIVKDILFDYYETDEEEYYSNDEVSINRKSKLIGIRCWWFSTTHQYCEETFNTKDLSLVIEEDDLIKD